MLKELKSPKTSSYYELKNLVLGSDFQWHWIENSVNGEKVQNNHGIFSHVFLHRPTNFNPYPQECSVHVKLATEVFIDIVKENNIDVDILYRINANITIPTKNCYYGPIHTDHDFPHQNMIVYLTDSNGGPTVVGNEKFYGREDDIIIFSGEHRVGVPTENRRVVLVYTFDKIT